MTWKRSEIREARQAPLAPVLAHLGYRTEPAHEGNLRVLGLPGRCLVKDHYWIWDRHADAAEPDAPDAEPQAGNAIDFLVRVHGMSFNDAMHALRS